MSNFRSAIGIVSTVGLLSLGGAQIPTAAHADGNFIKGLAAGIGGALLLREITRDDEAKANPQPQTRSQTQSATPRAAKPRPAAPRTTIATFPTSRAEVRDYQTRLNTLGYNAGAPDGLYGGKTRRAVSAFQASIGSQATGRLTPSDAGYLVQQSDQFATGLAQANPAVTAAANPNAHALTPAFPAPATQQHSQAPAPAFPSVGAAGAGGQQQLLAPAPAFPSVGGANAGGQQVAAVSPSFPTVAGGAQPNQNLAATPQPTFPTLGVQQPAAQTATPAYPAPNAAGGATTAAPAAQQPTFPTLGGQQGQQQQTAPTFPSVGGGAEAQTQEASISPSFPQVATPNATTVAMAGAQPQQATFPALGQPNAVAQPAAPAPQAPQVTQIAVQPTQEVPPTVEAYSILGVSTGQSYEEALSVLQSEGYGACNTIETVTHCVNQASSIRDIVSLNVMPTAEGGNVIGAMARRLDFGTPIDKTQLAGMMADRYASLLSAPDSMVATPDCRAATDVATASNSELTAQLVSEDTSALANMIDNCGRFSRIVYGEDTAANAVNQISIFLYEGAVFAASPNRPKAAPAIKF